MSHEERIKFKNDLDLAIEEARSKENLPEQMCGENISDCVIDDKTPFKSLVDPDGIIWNICQCLYCKRSFVLKDNK